MTTIEEVFKECRIEGLNVFLPDVTLERKLYKQVADRIKLIGGTWDRKTQGFKFFQDPSELFGKVKEGEKVNLKKEFQFFPTPDKIADKLVELSDINDSFGTDSVLEPSAGQGAIVNAIHRKFPDIIVDYCELMDINREFMKKIKNVRIMCQDFLLMHPDNMYNRIIANPPFRNNQDVDHIMKMYTHLNPGGVLVTVCSKHWIEAKEKKCKEFRKYLESKDVEVFDLEAGEFSESGTKIATQVLKIVKEF